MLHVHIRWHDKYLLVSIVEMEDMRCFWQFSWSHLYLSALKKSSSSSIGSFLPGSWAGLVLDDGIVTLLGFINMCWWSMKFMHSLCSDLEELFLTNPPRAARCQKCQYQCMPVSLCMQQGGIFTEQHHFTCDLMTLLLHALVFLAGKPELLHQGLPKAWAKGWSALWPDRFDRWWQSRCQISEVSTKQTCSGHWCYDHSLFP